MQASERLKKYFKNLEIRSKQLYDLASAARKRYIDPEEVVEISLAKNMAERVVGLISVVAPQIVDSGLVERIIELEKKYGSLDWRISFIIAHEISQEKFCSFNNKKEAIEVGIRTGFAYSTVGVVSSPLDGLINIEFKQRRDGKGEYMCLNYAGPIRNAGGTNAAVSVLIADYVRKKMGYNSYDADEQEINRAKTELDDYHERVTNLQYKPSKNEIDFLMKHIPVEIGGEPSERREVSNYKDLPRVPTNFIRSGYCLILSSCIPLKAPKLWKQLSKWGSEFDMDQWDFLEEFLSIQKKSKAKGGKKKTNQKITPDYTFISDLVAGRPVLGHPLAKGSFRLRYGRSRTSGYSAQSIHPATMILLYDYIANGTQLKVERPGKGTVFSSCDSIEGPIIKLKDGSVVKVQTVNYAKQIKKQVDEILFLGDVLVSYGDFFNRAHPLCPVGYCEEWWFQELKKAFGTEIINYSSVAEKTNLPEARLLEIFSDPLTIKPNYHEAQQLSHSFSVPLHPEYTFHWKDITVSNFLTLVNWISKAKLTFENEVLVKAVIPYDKKAKRILEFLGVPHILATEFIVVNKDYARALFETLQYDKNVETFISSIQTKSKQYDSETDALQLVNDISPYTIRDKSGTYIGSRMGRPEKSKMRKLTGSPQSLFPVGEEGGRLRSFQSALEKGKVTADFALFHCSDCDHQTVLPICEQCNKKTVRHYYCTYCMKSIPEKRCEVHDTVSVQKSQTRSVNINSYFTKAIKLLHMDIYPDLIKGVRGTINKDHIPEHLVKGVLRAKHKIYVNKDGTVRYDCTEMACTHFKPHEIRTSVSQLKELGYTHDIYGKSLEHEDQVLELYPQDVILPSSPNSPEEPSDVVLSRVTKFIDDLLTLVYKQNTFYNVKSFEDLIGHLIIGLAPHTSAGIVGRIIGFSKIQSFYAHPYFHAANRRDCDGDEIGFMLLLDGFLNFSRKFLPSSRGGTMDAPLVLTSVLAPAEVDDMAFDLDIANEYPLELYEAAQEYKMPWDVSVKQIKETLGTPAQYEGMLFTHPTSDINTGVLCSAYKTLPSMQEKLHGQMLLAERIRGVDKSDVARLVIEKHLIKDTRGNLRKFSMQSFRCVQCNTKYRRPPLKGICLECNGKLLFTISEGSVIKYLETSLKLAEKYDVYDYLKQSLAITKTRIEGVFGKEQEKQVGLTTFFSA